MIKLVAFDWNGTILSDTKACVEADNASLEIMGLKPITLKKFQETFEIPVINFYKKIGVDPKMAIKHYDKTESVFHELYERRAARARTRAGARQLLVWLEKHKVGSIIFSNHIDFQITKHLKRLKIEKYFQDVIANGEIGIAFKGRTKGEKLRNYLKKNDIKASETLVVGDTTEEIEIARDLKAISIALTDGYNSTRRLKAAKPDYLLGDLRQIEDIIKNNHSF